MVQSHMTLAPAYVLVGHVTRDLQPNGGFTPGGTVTYSARAAQKLGCRLRIVTAASEDFAAKSIMPDAEWIVLPSNATTTFRNEYHGGDRVQTVGPVAEPIVFDNVRSVCPPGAIVHLAPVAQEIPISTVRDLEGAWLGATLQGWMREWDASGRVRRGELEQIERFLPRLAAAVLSIEDIAGDWALARHWASLTRLLVVTRGEEGCSVFVAGRESVIPARPANVSDPTGAGDIFAAAFFLRYREIGDPWDAAAFANAYASMALEGPLPDRATALRYSRKRRETVRTEAFEP